MFCIFFGTLARETTMNRKVQNVLLSISMSVLLVSCYSSSGLSGDGSTDSADDSRELIHDVQETSDVPQDYQGFDAAQCIRDFSACGCSAPCMGGYSDYVWYPRDAGGPFPDVVTPSVELLDIGIARRVCAVCGCENTWRIKYEGDWTYVSVEEMCNFIADYDRTCGGCLDMWEGSGE